MAFVVIGSVVTDSIVKGSFQPFWRGHWFDRRRRHHGQFKMTMGIDELESGMALVPLLIGVFVISEVIVQAEKAAKIKMMDVAQKRIWIKAKIISWAEFKRCTPLMFRSPSMDH